MIMFMIMINVILIKIMLIIIMMVIMKIMMMMIMSMITTSLVVVTDNVASLLGVVGDTAGGRQQGGFVARDLLHLGTGRGEESRTISAWILSGYFVFKIGHPKKLED